MSNYVPTGCAVDVDWEDFRRETAKNMLPIMAQMKITNGKTALRFISKESAVRLAIEYADELIKQIKEEQK